MNEHNLPACCGPRVLEVTEPAAWFGRFLADLGPTP